MKKIIITASALLASVCALAQQGGLDAETLKQANNPMAHIKTFNVHDYYVTSIYGMPDGVTQNQAMLRYAQPLGRFIIRATMPFVTASNPAMTADDGSLIPSRTESGLGDFNMFVIYDMFKRNGIQIGLGPQVVLPSGTNGMSANKWQAGLSGLFFNSKNEHVQYGGLLQWQASFAGDEDYADVSLLTSQLFFMWQLGGGTYLRSTGVWSFDLHNDTGNIPIGLGIGKVLKVGGAVFNIFAEPQFSVWTYGRQQPRFQTFVGFNTQF